MQDMTTRERFTTTVIRSAALINACWQHAYLYHVEQQGEPPAAQVGPK